jgi:hypothetical protein
MSAFIKRWQLKGLTLHVIVYELGSDPARWELAALADEQQLRWYA